MSFVVLLGMLAILWKERKPTFSQGADGCTYTTYRGSITHAGSCSSIVHLSAEIQVNSHKDWPLIGKTSDPEIESRDRALNAVNEARKNLFGR